MNELVQPCCPFTPSMRCCTLCAARARHGDGCARARSRAGERRRRPSELRARNCARMIAELRAYREVLCILLRRFEPLSAVGELLITQPQRRRELADRLGE